MKKETIPKPTSDANTIVQTGDAVTLHYTGTLSDGSTFDSSDGKSPLTFEAGASEVIPGFDSAVEGMKIGDEKKFTISCEEAYGPIRAELMKEFPKKQLPPELTPEVGMQLAMQGPQGQAMPVTIAKVGTDSITIDLNHPLAGKDLTFAIKIIAINDPKYAAEKHEGGCCSEEGAEGGCGSGSCGEGGCGSGECGTDKESKGGCGTGNCCK